LVKVKVVIALDSGLFNRAIHALDLAVGPEMARLREAVFDAVLGANAVKQVRQGPGLVAHVAKLDAVVGEHRVHPVRQFGQDAAQKLSGCQFGSLWLQLGKGHFAGAVNGYNHILAAFFGLHFGKIDVQIPNRILPELLFGRAYLALSQGQAANAVALKAPV
jgi:hypothetical protein